MTTCYDAIVKLRAVREFKPDPLRDDDLGAILEAARWTGSSKNRQDWSFIVLTGDRLEGLAEHGDYTDPIRASAATIVLVKEDGGNLFDIGRAAQNIMLAAKTSGERRDGRRRLLPHHPPPVWPGTGIPRRPGRDRDALCRRPRISRHGGGAQSIRGKEAGRDRGEVRPLLTPGNPDGTSSDRH